MKTLSKTAATIMSLAALGGPALDGPLALPEKREKKFKIEFSPEELERVRALPKKERKKEVARLKRGRVPK